MSKARRGSVTFPTDHDTKPEACADPSAPEGFLDKYLSHRWVVTYMCSLMFVALPMLQNCITMVLVCMESNYIEPTSNKNLSKTTNNISGRAETNIWNIRLEGDVRSQVLTAEFYAFPFTPLIGGYLSGKFSAKRVMILIILLLAGSSALTPLVLTFNPYIAIGLRCVSGLSSGGLQSSLTELLSKWAPLNERAQIVSTAMAGGCNFLVLIPWILFVYDTPFEHPRIKPDEIKRIRHRRRDSTVAKMPRPPWLQILRSGPFWGLLTVHMGYNFIATTMGTFLPIYLNDILKFDVTVNGLASSMPPLARFLASLGGGHISDLLISRGTFSTTVVRKIFMATGNILSVPFLVGLSFMDRSQASYAVILVVLFWFIQALNTCSLRVNQIDIAPRYAGVLTVFLVLGSGTEQSWAKDPNFNMEMGIAADKRTENKSASSEKISDKAAINDSTPNGQPQNHTVDNSSATTYDEQAQDQTKWCSEKQSDQASELSSPEEVVADIKRYLVTRDVESLCDDETDIQASYSAGVLNEGFVCDEDIKSTDPENAFHSFIVQTETNGVCGSTDDFIKFNVRL
uniref:Sialin n=1 Tax=Magallana gigas TaxID=29159 RepID=K1QS88_MAGGI